MKEQPKVAMPVVDHSLVGRLKAQRSARLEDLSKLQFEIAELDGEIAWLERFPQVERIIRSLMGKV